MTFLRITPEFCLCGRRHPCSLHSNEAILLVEQELKRNGDRTQGSLFDAEPVRPVVDVVGTL